MNDQISGHPVPVINQPRRVRLLWFSLCIGIFWYAEYLYQYRVFEPGNFQSAWIRSHALAGTTLIAAGLFASLLFKFVPAWVRYWHLRRWLGVSGALLVSLHVFGVWQFVYDFAIAPLFLSWHPYDNPALFGLFAYPILLAMLITSTDWMVRKLKKWWKFLHRFVYLAEIFIVLHVVLIGGPVMKTPPGLLLYALGAAVILGQIYWWFMISKIQGFKRAGFYVGLGLIALAVYLLYWAAKKGLL